MSVEWPNGTIADFVDGLDEATDQLGWRLASDGLERFRHNIETNTPVNTGALRSSYRLTPVHYGAVSSGAGGRIASMAWTGTVYTEVGYAEFVERGTGLYGPEHKMYEIKPKTPDGVLHWVMPGGGHVFAKHVWHPGSPGAAMFRIGAVLTEHEVDEWAHRALREWERSVAHRAEVRTKARVKWAGGFN
jgi:hypothetical protein